MTVQDFIRQYEQEHGFPPPIFVLSDVLGMSLAEAQQALEKVHTTVTGKFIDDAWQPPIYHKEQAWEGRVLRPKDGMPKELEYVPREPQPVVAGAGREQWASYSTQVTKQVSLEDALACVQAHYAKSDDPLTLFELSCQLGVSEGNARDKFYRMESAGWVQREYTGKNAYTIHLVSQETDKA